MIRAPYKFLLVAAVVLGTGVTGVALLRGQANKGSEVGGAAAEIASVRKDLSEMNKGRAEVQAILARAKKEKDIIKINCVQRKLDQIKNLIALAREQFSKYLMDKASGAAGSPVSLRQRIAMFKERVDEKVEEAKQCAGEAIKITDKPEIEVVEPPDKGDPTEPGGPIWVTPRPPDGSPFL